jgi:twitching motility protein PilT
MAQLDPFLAALSEYRAEALVLEQDRAPAFRFLSGIKAVSKQVLKAERILKLVKELSSKETLEEFEKDGTSSFVYQVGDTAYSGTIERETGKVVATVWEATQSVANGAEAHGSAAADARETASSDAGNGLAELVGEETAAALATETASVKGHAGGAKKKPKAGKGSAASAVDPTEEPLELPSLEDAGTDAIIPDDLPPNYRADIDRMLTSMTEKEASDLHLCCGHSPSYRIDGAITYDDSWPPLQAEELFRMLFAITPKRNREQFLREHDTDFAYAIEGVCRFRCNLFFDRLGPGAVFRAIPNEIIPADKLGLPKIVHDLAALTKGLVLITGPTGSGKSTTLASILDICNCTRDDHVITIEDPVEFVHPNKRCLINQREVGIHTKGFKAALRAALREDPNIVLVGELRDLETMAMAIETAETGHLVFGTLHTTTAATTVDRIIDQFPPDQQAQIRVMLSESLECVISQTLCKKKHGGRVAAMEVLVVTHSVSNLIREGKTFQIEGMMQTGRKHGMQLLNDHLLELVTNDVIEPHEAYLRSMNKLGLQEAFQRSGITLNK